MHHTGTKTIEGERLLLRQFHPDDAEAMFNRWAGNADAVRFMSWPRHATIDDSDNAIKTWLKKYHKNKFYHWCLEAKATGAAIGECYVKRLYKKVDAVLIDYCFAPDTEPDLVREMWQMILPFFFREVAVARIECSAATADTERAALLEALGFHYEGTMRRACLTQDGAVDCRLYSLLQSEWPTH